MKNSTTFRLLSLLLVVYLFPCSQLSAQVGGVHGSPVTRNTAVLADNTSTTYYIATAANGGSNSNDGSVGSPWLTLAYACAHATTSSDIIYVNAGTYTETAECSVAVGVSIVGANKTTSIIKSHYYVKRIGGNVTSAAISFKSGSEGTNGNQSISNLTIDGDNLQGGIAILVLRRSNVIIYDCTIKDFFIGGILLHGGNSMFSEPSTYNSGNQVYNCTIRNCSAVDNHDDHNWNKAASIELTGESNFSIHDNSFILTDKPSGENGENLDCNWYNKGGTIYNNVFTMHEYEENAWSFQMVLFNNKGGIEICNNTFTGGDCKIDIAGDFHYKGDYNYSYYIHNNYFTGNPTVITDNNCAIIMEDQNINDVIVTRNHFYNLVHLFEINSTNNVSNSFNRINISYNILEYCGWHIAYTWIALITINNDSQSLFTDINFYNNVILGDQICVTSAIAVHPEGTITNLNIKNNIIEHNGNGTWLDVQNSGTIDGLYVDNNVLYDNENNNDPTFSGNAVSNYTFLNNIKSDPLFVSSTDFYLAPSSPAINSGVYVSLTTDYNGNKVSDPPEIGAYEYIGENRPPSIIGQSFQIDKNSPNGTIAGTVVASDPDAGQTLDYTIVSGNTDGAFAINASTGVLSVANTAALNVDFALVVKVQDNGGLSRQATITINIIPTGIEPTGNNSTIKVYPNPVSDELIIEIEGNKDRPGFEILNSTGNIVFKGDLSERTIVSTTNFSPGIYIIKLQNGKTFEFKKILKL